MASTTLINSNGSTTIRDRIRELRRVPAKDLLPNPKNWRRHRRRRSSIARTSDEIGYADALLARELSDGQTHADRRTFARRYNAGPRCSRC